MVKKLHAAAQFIKLFLEKNSLPLPKVALIAGSGLAGLDTLVKHGFTLPYDNIPGFPTPTVEGHIGEMLFGDISGLSVCICRGRFHLYEGYSPADVVFAVRVLGLLGVKTLIVTNAAGSLNPLFAEGSLMLVSDHINLTGQNPLIGENIESLGIRFPDMSKVYDKTLREQAQAAALEHNILLHQGVYIGITGPSLETPAETRAFRMLGADAIGMSTVLEVIAARHMNMNVLGISCLANQNLPDCMEPVTFDHVLQTVKKAESTLVSLLNGLLQKVSLFS